jgi:putative membrane protein
MFIYFPLSGRATNYIHPKLVPMMLICGVIFILMSLIFFYFIKLFDSKKFKFTSIIFVVPIMIAFLVPTVSVNTNFAGVSDMGVNEKINDNTENVDQSIITKTPNINPVKKIINMDTENFMTTLEDMYAKIDNYIDYEIEIEGFAYKESKFGDNKFIIARSLMACCAADTQIIGLMCNYDKVDSLEKNDWFHVNGRVKKYEYEGNIVPMIEIEKITPMEKPESSYVYPY